MGIYSLDNRSLSVRLAEILDIINNRDTDPNTILEQVDILVRILRSTGDVTIHISRDAVISSLRLCVADQRAPIRIAGFRALRHFILSAEDVKRMMEMQIDIFIVM